LVHAATKAFTNDSFELSHLHSGERILEITVAAEALVLQPLAFGAPLDTLFGLPDILTLAAKAECV
jgi:hypothetical protein